MNSINLFVIRHGRTKANKKGICLGWTDSFLTPEAKKELVKLGKKLGKKSITAIFVSDLKRAKTSLKIINKHIKSENIFVTREFRELNFGCFEHKNPQLIKNVQPEIYDKEGLFLYNCNLKEGESLKDLEKRVRSGLAKIKHSNTKGNVLIITHGSVIAMLHHIFHNKSYNYFYKTLNLNSYNYHIFKI